MLPMSALAKAELKKEKQEKVSAGEVHVKNEPMDDTDALSNVETSSEAAMSVGSSSGRSSPESGEGREISCKHLLKRVAKSEKEELVFLQLPDVLPGQPSTEILPNSKGDADTVRKDGKQGEEDPQKPASCSLADFSEGYVGKLRVRRSGKTELVLGNVVLDVSMGTPCGFLQDVVSIRTEEEDPRMTVLGHLRHRMICTPNFESLLRSSLNT
ncbi:hypothetical protein BaRGS_00032893 [Batillaria attramentaria]|uniref:DNA-directed RNA polymerase III subunit RPC4 n=1 Tax=Batillaria attramentaria TaxID=370345 RepID=A0ABD0JM91_9CAEN